MKHKLLLLCALTCLGLASCGNNQSSSSVFSSVSVHDGTDGKDGKDGSDGKDGLDGKDGSDGKNGVDGKDGHDGKDGTDGKNGKDGTDGKDGLDGQDGTDGKDGLTPYIGVNGNWWIAGKDTGISASASQGSNGQNGTDGKNGLDGQTPYIGSNGNWWIAGADTGIYAQGKDAIDIFRVTFVDSEGNLLEACEVRRGESAYYGGDTPLKAADDENTYAFSGWDMPLNNVQQHLVIHPIFEPTKRSYEIKFLNEDGSLFQSLDVLYGEMPNPDSLPTKESDGKMNYVFAGWDHPIETVKGVATYKAIFAGDYAPEYYTHGVDFRHNPDEQSFSVYSYEGDAKNVVIPETFLGKPVTGITKEAFSGNAFVESIHIGANIDNIDLHSFDNMTNLKSFSVSKNNPQYFTRGHGELLRHIDEDDVEMVAMPATVNGMYTFDSDIVVSRESAFSATRLYIIKGRADQMQVNERFFRLFAHTPSKASVNVHDAIVDGGDIPDGLFANNGSLTSLSVMENEANPTVNIGDYAFYNLGRLKSIVLPNSVEFIGRKAFANNASLRELIIGKDCQSKLKTVLPGALEGTTNIDTNTIEDTYYIDKMVYLGNVIHEGGFVIEQRLIAYQAEQVKLDNPPTFVLDEEVVYIAEHCFEGLYFQKFYFAYDSSIPNAVEKICKVTSIGDYAFYNMTFKGAFAFRLPVSAEYFGDNLIHKTSNKLYNVSGGAQIKGLRNANNNIVYAVACNNTSATELIIPATLRGHSHDTFKDLGDVETITVQGDNPYYATYGKDDKLLTYRGESIIYGTWDYNGTLVLDETMPYIAPYGLYNTTINSVELHEGVKGIGTLAFSNRGDIAITVFDCTSTLQYLAKNFTNNRLNVTESVDTIRIDVSMFEMGEYCFGDKITSTTPKVALNDDAIPSYFNPLAFCFDKADSSKAIVPELNGEY